MIKFLKWGRTSVIWNWWIPSTIPSSRVCLVIILEPAGNRVRTGCRCPRGWQGNRTWLAPLLSPLQHYCGTPAMSQSWGLYHILCLYSKNTLHLVPMSHENIYTIEWSGSLDFLQKDIGSLYFILLQWNLSWKSEV